MIQVEPGEHRRSSSNTSKNLASLLFCFLLIVSICLAAFNFYLLAWIWSNFQGQLGPVNNQLGVNLLNELNFFNKHRHQGDKIRLSRNLMSEKSLSARHIEGNNQDRSDSLESSENDHARGPASFGSEVSALTLSSKNELRFGGGGNESARPSLVISAAQNSLAFPNGLLVRHASGSYSSQEPIVCGASQLWAGSNDDRRRPAHQCRLTSPRFELTGGQLLDFSNKSIQTNRLQAKRLHSPLNKIQLLSTDAIKFESKSKQIHVEALDTVALGSRNSIVIIKAKSIDLGKLIELKRQSKRVGQSGTRRVSSGYKLCVCLAPESSLIKSDPVKKRPTQLDEVEERQHESASNSDYSKSKRGLVFAVRSEFYCSKFSATICDTKH